MKRAVILVHAILLFSATGIYAELHDRGAGLIYDDVLDITWLQDANYANTVGVDDTYYGYDNKGKLPWDYAVRWVENLEYYDPIRGVTWKNWRLPHTLPVNGVSYQCEYSCDGSTDIGDNITSKNSEMAFMYYVNLGNKSPYDSQCNSQDGWGLINKGPFINIPPPDDHAIGYWSGTLFCGATQPSSETWWEFYFLDGYQPSRSEGGHSHVWPVMDGDVMSKDQLKSSIPGIPLLLLDE